MDANLGLIQASAIILLRSIYMTVSEARRIERETAYGKNKQNYAKRFFHSNQYRYIFD